MAGQLLRRALAGGRAAFGHACQPQQQWYADQQNQDRHGLHGTAPVEPDDDLGEQHGEDDRAYGGAGKQDAEGQALPVRCNPARGQGNGRDIGRGADADAAQGHGDRELVDVRAAGGEQQAQRSQDGTRCHDRTR
ncbi:hypothetical protein D9M71_667800 [compost metagenome]